MIYGLPLSVCLLVKDYAGPSAVSTVCELNQGGMIFRVVKPSLNIAGLHDMGRLHEVRNRLPLYRFEQSRQY